MKEIELKTKFISETIEKIKISKDYSMYSDLEFDLCILNNLLADEWKNHLIDKINFEAEERDLEKEKELKFIECRAKEGVKSNEVAKVEVNQIFSEKIKELEEKQKDLDMRNIDLRNFDKKHNGYERLANHLKDYFFKEYQGTNRTQ